jgi:hypothetical protein
MTKQLLVEPYTEFTWKNIIFQVKRFNSGGYFYRDKAHLGGPWTNLENTLNNSSIHGQFKRKLREARTVIESFITLGEGE